MQQFLGTPLYYHASQFYLKNKEKFENLKHKVQNLKYDNVDHGDL